MRLCPNRICVLKAKQCDFVFRNRMSTNKLIDLIWLVTKDVGTPIETENFEAQSLQYKTICYRIIVPFKKKNIAQRYIQLMIVYSILLHLNCCFEVKSSRHHFLVKRVNGMLRRTVLLLPLFMDDIQLRPAESSPYVDTSKICNYVYFPLQYSFSHDKKRFVIAL